LGIVLFLAYLATGIYQVQPGEVAIVRRFGRVLDEPRWPGLNIGLPWGLDRVDRLAVDEQRWLEVGFQETEQPRGDAAPPGQVLTGDNNLIDVRARIYYRVEPPALDKADPYEGMKQYVLHADRIDAVLLRAAEVALASTLAGQRVDVVLLGQARNLEPLIQERLAATIRTCRLGVAIESVNLTYVQPPAEVAEVFRQVNRARTEKATVELKALDAKQTELTVARIDARKILNEAQSDRQNRLARARAEADNFLALWQKFSDYTSDPQNALLTIYLKEMQTILSRFQVRTLSDQGVDQTIVLPLPER
jgi:membrane protease subunit HflK